MRKEEEQQGTTSPTTPTPGSEGLSLGDDNHSTASFSMDTETSGVHSMAPGPAPNISFF